MTGRLQAVILIIVAAVMAVCRFFAAAGRGKLSRSRRHIIGLSASHADPAVCAAIDAVEKVFVRDFNWPFRRLSYPQESGIDARAEILDNGWSTGRFLAMQIRPAPPARDDRGDYMHQIQKRDLDYWTSHSLSICVILFNPDSGDIAWQWASAVSGNDRNEERWLLTVPASNVMDASARLSFEEAIQANPQMLLRSALAVDRALMERISDHGALFIWDEWGDSSPMFRNLRVFLDKDEPEIQVDYRIRAHDLHELMVQLFPWASYSYAEPINEYSGKVAVHVLEVQVRPEALAYLEAEEFLEAGYPEEQDPPSPETEDYMTDEEEAAFWQSRRASRGSAEPEN
ncbi:DUF4365 domain-containing protein [Rhizobium sp. P40RR-XXII]|uniref:DUF4365 domain-containing protein n=1 Tax=Rhizobium sp. P40RR-XXII TaxID=2726739 RepID=UPI00145772B0|nr:DUF4365 domain-containing protein [Rhizobium sp. P40RR-XXII]NLS17592.1 DUF4365 domain-containing protein [Rhizobium sp. P40RR-XXII]